MFCDRSCKEAFRRLDGRAAESALKSYYKKRYGLDLAQVQKMRDGGCSICGAANSAGRWGNLHIDHDHVTGRVRGALCHNCNVGLGHFHSDPDLLEAAMRYLTTPPIDLTP